SNLRSAAVKLVVLGSTAWLKVIRADDSVLGGFRMRVDGDGVIDFTRSPSITMFAVNASSAWPNGSSRFWFIWLPSNWNVWLPAVSRRSGPTLTVYCPGWCCVVLKVSVQTVLVALWVSDVTVTGLRCQSVTVRVPWAGGPRVKLFGSTAMLNVRVMAASPVASFTGPTGDQAVTARPSMTYLRTNWS